MTIRQLCDNDPAVAIKHLIDGLLNHKKIRNFKLNLDSPSKYENGICTGGMAIVTLIKILDMSFAPPELSNNIARADLMQTDRRDLLDFEEAIGFFVQGSLLPIERYFDLSISGIFFLPWSLQNGNWESEILEVINFWEQLTGRRYEKLAKDIDERWERAASSVAIRLASDHQVAAGEQRFGRVGGLEG